MIATSQGLPLLLFGRSYGGTFHLIGGRVLPSEAEEVLPVVDVSGVTSEPQLGNPVHTVDGDSTTAWSFIDTPRLLILPLTFPATVGRVSLTWVENTTRRIVVHVSEDGIHWRAHWAGSTTGSGVSAHSIPDVRCSYVGIECWGSSALQEVAVFGATRSSDPTLAPDVPVLYAVAGSNIVDLRWGGGSINRPVFGAERENGYTLEAASSETGPWEVLYQGSDRAFEHQGLTSGSSYFYRVAAHGVGTGTTYSAVRSSVPETATLLPITSVSASTHDGNAPANVLDGNFSTRWSGDGDGATLTATLDKTHLVGDVQIAWYSGSERRAFFDILLSEDGVEWFPGLLEGVSSGTTTNLETYKLTAGYARYVRLVGHGNSGSSWNSVLEFRVRSGVPFGEEAEPQPDVESTLLSSTVLSAWNHRWTSADWAQSRNALIEKRNSYPDPHWYSGGDGDNWNEHGDCPPITGGHQPRQLGMTATAVMAAASSRSDFATSIRNQLLYQTTRSGSGFARGDMHTINSSKNTTLHPWYIIADYTANVAKSARWALAVFSDLFTDAELAQILDWCNGVAHGGPSSNSIYWAMQRGRTNIIGTRDPDNYAHAGQTNVWSYAGDNPVYREPNGTYGPRPSTASWYTNREDGIVEGGLHYALLSLWVRTHRPSVIQHRQRGSATDDQLIIDYVKHYVKEKLIYAIHPSGGALEWDRGYQSSSLGAGLGASYANGSWPRIAAMALDIFEVLGDAELMTWETTRGVTLSGRETDGSPADCGYTIANGYSRTYNGKGLEWAMVAVTDSARGTREFWRRDGYNRTDNRAFYQFRAGPRPDGQWEVSLQQNDLPNRYYNNPLIQSGTDWLYSQNGGHIGDDRGVLREKWGGNGFDPGFHFQWVGLDPIVRA